MLNNERTHIAIVDYGMGNLFSVQQACEYAGFKAVITHDRKQILEAAGIILPGVGAFGDAMANLKKLDLIVALRDYVTMGRPLMGICMGMQLLMGHSEEFGFHEGLGIIEGAVVRFPDQDNYGQILKVPQVGWNRIFIPDGKNENFWAASPLNDIANGEFMYFVHSFYVKPVAADVALSVSTYKGVTYCSALQKEGIFATQFHPERSAQNGLQIYKNWRLKITEPCQK